MFLKENSKLRTRKTERAIDSDSTIILKLKLQCSDASHLKKKTFNSLVFTDQITVTKTETTKHSTF